MPFTYYFQLGPGGLTFTITDAATGMTVMYQRMQYGNGKRAGEFSRPVLFFLFRSLQRAPEFSTYLFRMDSSSSCRPEEFSIRPFARA